ncbi:hypothetical protein Pmar_PMAR006273, partial [Perkinsus marinus ATCC 50983]
YVAGYDSSRVHYRHFGDAVLITSHSSPQSPNWSSSRSPRSATEFLGTLHLSFRSKVTGVL